MVVLLVLLVLLSVAAVVSTVRAVAGDGYGARPDRCDRFAARRPI